MLHINYQYIIHIIKDQISANPDSRILDYGCGRGEIVKWGRDKGFEVFGADTFDRGIEERLLLENREFLDFYIRQIENGKTGYADNFFDLIVCNQVFEHIEDLDGVLKEIRRILKPGARIVTLFPSKEVIREGHIGIPLAHWFPKGGKIRFYYTLSLRSIGIGTDYKTKVMPAREWAEQRLNFIDTRTFYLPKKKIYALLNKYFTWEHLESDYICFRAGKMNNAIGRAIIKTQQWPLGRRVGGVAFRYLAGFVISAQKPV